MIFLNISGYLCDFDKSMDHDGDNGRKVIRDGKPAAQRENDIESTDPRSESGYEPRMMAQPLPLSTTRALQELEDQGASLPLHGCFSCIWRDVEYVEQRFTSGKQSPALDQ